ncbi:putative Endo-beta-1,4-glucanase B [Blattamonas nauphoetae]|uniref:Endo-beta-1,4-glucanase B n=1 Tax=Blattamonas nauphoetae TaxID=2049346 RepID=A0ABQ9YK26_9EUKA|nr:putative Endo-beta-1,4-glucanase B [Blattamonas nauphoetae]
MLCYFGSNPFGDITYSYIYPLESDFDYYKRIGVKLFRVGMMWERFQPELGGPFRERDITDFKEVISQAYRRGIYTLIDQHNYFMRALKEGDSYTNHICGCEVDGEVKVTVQDFAAFWKKLAQEFKDVPGVYAYGLTNEPEDDDCSVAQWVLGAQAAINAIREVDNRTWIFVAGNEWSTSKRWPIMSDHLKTLTDPANRIVYEAHCYFSEWGNAEYEEGWEASGCTFETPYERSTPFLDWIKTNKKRGFFGEFNIPNNDTASYDKWKTVLQSFLDHLVGGDQGGTIFSGGPWYEENMLNVEPVDGVPIEHMSLYSQYTARTATFDTFSLAASDEKGKGYSCQERLSTTALLGSATRCTTLAQAMNAIGDEIDFIIEVKSSAALNFNADLNINRQRDALIRSASSTVVDFKGTGTVTIQPPKTQTAAFEMERLNVQSTSKDSWIVVKEGGSARFSIVIFSEPASSSYVVSSASLQNADVCAPATASLAAVRASEADELIFEASSFINLTRPALVVHNTPVSIDTFQFRSAMATDPINILASCSASSSATVSIGAAAENFDGWAGSGVAFSDNSSPFIYSTNCTITGAAAGDLTFGSLLRPHVISVVMATNDDKDGLISISVVGSRCHVCTIDGEEQEMHVEIRPQPTDVSTDDTWTALTEQFDKTIASDDGVRVEYRHSKRKIAKNQQCQLTVVAAGTRSNVLTFTTASSKTLRVAWSVLALVFVLVM